MKLENNSLTLSENFASRTFFKACLKLFVQVEDLISPFKPFQVLGHKIETDFLEISSMQIGTIKLLALAKKIKIYV